MPAVRQATMSALNESLVLDYVREHSQTSRPAIARDLGLSAASVSRIVGRLIREGLVTGSANPADGPGRPASRVSFNHRAGCVLAIDLGGTKCHGVLADLAGDVLAEDVRPTNGAGSPYQTLLASIAALTAQASTAPLVAAAFGVPAIIHPLTGVVLEGPSVLWRDFPLADELRRTLKVPFVVDNDVKLSALAQAWRGPGRGVADFATISIGTGIGAGVVANGELVRGRNNVAGEIGYLIVRPDQLTERPADRLGGLERVISGPAIARRARALLVADPASAGDLDPGQVTSEQVFAAARANHPVACRVVDEVIETLLIGLIALTVIAGPSLIILDGGVGRSLEPYLDRLRAGLAAQLPWVPQLAVSHLGPNATVVGAIATALWLDRQRAAPELRRAAYAPPTVHAHVG
jgi:glucokinase